MTPTPTRFMVFRALPGLAASGLLMAVSGQDNSRTFVATGTAAPVAISFPWAKASDLIVQRLEGGADSADDGDPETLNSSYSIGGSGRATPPAQPTGFLTEINLIAGRTYRIERKTALLQKYLPRMGIAGDASAQESQLDDIVMSQQDLLQLADMILTRAAMLPRGDSAGLLPPLDDMKGKFPAIDALGRWYAASGTGNDPNLRTDMANPAVGPALFGWVQTFATAAVAKVRNLFDKFSDHLDIRDFDGADPTGATDSTAAFIAAILEMAASQRPLRISRGQWKVSASLFPAAYIENAKIFGDGRKNTRIINQAIGVPLFNVGNTYNLILREFSIEGNGLTGVAGNGHAIAGADPDMNVDPHLPGWATIERLNITGHRGVGKTVNNANMQACAIYFANALQGVVDHCYFGNNGFGVYAYKAQNVEFRTCAWESNRYGALINDQCENLRLFNPDMVGVNDIDTGGTVHVQAAGAAAGGTDVRAGAVVDFYGAGSEYVGGKYKNHRYSGLSLYSPRMPLVTGAWIRQDDAYAGVCGIYNAFGARVIANEFTYAGSAVAVARTGYKADMLGGFQDLGVLRDNKFSFNGNGAFGTCIDLAVPAGASRLVGVVTGNVGGSAEAVSGASTLTDWIKVTGGVRKLELRGNGLTASSNLTVTNAYNFAIAAVSDEGLIDDGNSAVPTGTGVITNVRTASPAATGLLPSGNYKVRALQVGADVVVGSRDTGWTAATGAGSKGAFAAAAAGAASVGYVQAELQGALNRVAALEARLKAYDAALFAHGLIGA